MAESSSSETSSQSASFDKVLVVELGENATAEQRQEAINARMDVLFNDLEKGLINPDTREEALANLQGVCAGMDSITFKDQNGNDVKASFQQEDYMNMNKRVVKMAGNVFKSEVERNKLKEQEQNKDQKAGPQQKQQGQKAANPNEEPNLYLAILEAIAAIFKLIVKIFNAIQALADVMEAKFGQAPTPQESGLTAGALDLNGLDLQILTAALKRVTSEKTSQGPLAPGHATMSEIIKQAASRASHATVPEAEPAEDPMVVAMEEAIVPDADKPETEVTAPGEAISMIADTVQPAVDDVDNASAEEGLTADGQTPALALAEAEPAVADGSAPEVVAQDGDGAQPDVAPAPMEISAADANGVEQDAPAMENEAPDHAVAEVTAIPASRVQSFTAFQSNGGMISDKKRTPKQENTARIKAISHNKGRETTAAFQQNLGFNDFTPKAKLQLSA